MHKKNVVLTCKDYAVSNEKFELLLDETLEMLITSPQPSKENLGKYYESEDYISHTDSKKSFIDRIYQFVKGYAIGKKVLVLERNAPSNSKTKTVLDIGCGTGDFLAACQRSNWDVLGVEPNPKARVISETKIDGVVLTDISEIVDKRFDCITMWHVLEHVPDLKNYIISLKQLLSPGGSLIVAVPNFKSFDAVHYGKFWAAYDVPRHLWHFSRASIEKLFGKEQMKVVQIIPMKFDSFYVSLLSEKYKTGKSNLAKAFFIGLVSNIKAFRSKKYSSLIYVIKND